MPELTEQETLDILGAICAQITNVIIDRYKQNESMNSCEDAIKAHPQFIDFYTKRMNMSKERIANDTEKLHRLLDLRDKFKSLLNKEAPSNAGI